jgi:hypothetical protein
MDAILDKMAYEPQNQSLMFEMMVIEKNLQELYSDFELMAKQLRHILGEQDQYNADAAYYRVIMKNVQADSTLMNQWTDLLMTMKLTNPAIEEELRNAATGP